MKYFLNLPHEKLKKKQKLKNKKEKKMKRQKKKQTKRQRQKRRSSDKNKKEKDAIFVEDEEKKNDYLKILFNKFINYHIFFELFQPTVWVF